MATMALKSKAPDAVKLFVGQIPKHMSEEELLPIFQEAGSVSEINVIRDKSTKQSRGCCFLTYSSRSEADNAIEMFHNKRTVPPVNSPMQVKYADGELERLEHKLFVGMLPKSATDADVKAVFSNYGTIKELQIIKGSQQTAKACAFLKFETKEQAAAAVEGLNGIHKMEGSTSALVVKWADTEKERQARKLQKLQAPVPQVNVVPPQPPYGGMPPPFNGYAYQAPPYGMVPPYSAPSTVQNPTGTTPTPPDAHHGSGVLSPTGYMNNMGGYPPPQYPFGYPGGPFMNQTYPAPVMNMNPAQPPVPPKAVVRPANIGPQAEGPPGANLFIYHIPAEFGDTELSTAFASFGNVVSAKVFVDKTTGISKCFGFVSYDTPEAAQAAINVMNGFQLSGKRLKVQLKRDNKSNKPY